MARLLQIAKLGHPVLREPGKKVSNPVDSHIQELIADMFATLEESKGVGLAAPQVYESWCLFVMDPHPTSRYPDAPESEPEVVVNPEIISGSQEVESGWEGCLSIPGIRALVPRHVSISVRYWNAKGEENRVDFDGFPARVFQHEFDHLNGTVIFDRVEDPRDIIMESEWLRLVRQADK